MQPIQRKKKNAAYGEFFNFVCTYSIRYSFEAIETFCGIATSKKIFACTTSEEKLDVYKAAPVTYDHVKVINMHGKYSQTIIYLVWLFQEHLHQSSYTFTASCGQQQDNANALPQYQHPPQMLAPPAGQPWPSSIPQSVAAVTSVQQTGVQSSGTASSDPVANTTNPGTSGELELSPHVVVGQPADDSCPDQTNGFDNIEVDKKGASTKDQNCSVALILKSLIQNPVMLI